MRQTDWPGFTRQGHQCADICGVPEQGRYIRRCKVCGKVWRYKKTGFGLWLYMWKPAGLVTKWRLRRQGVVT